MSPRADYRTRDLRTKLYMAIRANSPVTIHCDEAALLLEMMGHRVSANLYVCDECGTIVRTPAALARDGLRPYDLPALADHLDDCSWACTFRPVTR